MQQCRVIGVTEGGVGFANRLRMTRRLARRGNTGEPTDATQRRKPNELLLRKKHEIKPLAKLLCSAGIGELFCSRFLLGEAVE